METLPLAELQTFVHTLLARLHGKESAATLIALQGELGAGKTTFVQALAKELGVTDAVQSPTYVLMKKYEVVHPHFKTLIHIDAYRLEAAAQVGALKPEEFLDDPHTLVCVEWFENVKEALPKPDITVNLSSTDAKQGERYIEVV